MGLFSKKGPVEDLKGQINKLTEKTEEKEKHEIKIIKEIEGIMNNIFKIIEENGFIADDPTVQRDLNNMKDKMEKGDLYAAYQVAHNLSSRVRNLAKRGTS
ncbi:MAG: hypothetical protein R6U32_06510 [Candidatus Woesearchaeota archaeon]